MRKLTTITLVLVMAGMALAAFSNPATTFLAPASQSAKPTHDQIVATKAQIAAQQAAHPVTPARALSSGPGQPKPFATFISEGFDGTTFPPTGWTMDSAYVWDRSTMTTWPSGFLPHTGAGMAEYDDWDIYYDGCGLITPSFTLAAQAPHVTFWYFKNNITYDYGDSLHVFYNVNGGAWTLLGDYSPYNGSNTWLPVDITLPTITGNVQVKFLAYSHWMYNIYVDDVLIYTPVTTDVGVSSITLPGSTFTPGTPVVPTCNVTNHGTATQTSIPVTAWIDSAGGRFIATGTVASLAGGVTVSCPLSPSFTPGNQTSYTLTYFTNLTGDMDRSNDTAHGTTWVSWQTIPINPVSTDRLGHATAYDPVGDKIYMIGGCPAGAGGTNVANCDMFDPALNTWTARASKPTPTDWGPASYCRGKLYYITGMTNSSTAQNNTEVYNIAGNSWTTATPRPLVGGFTVAGGMQVTWKDSLIYCIGGGDMSVYNGYPDVNIYNPFTDAWYTGTPMLTAVCNGGAAIIGDTIYLTGSATNWYYGSYVTNMYKGAINPASPTSITWTVGPALPTNTAFGAATALGNRVYAWGGVVNGAGGANNNTGWYYDQADGAIHSYVPWPGTGIERGQYIVGREMGMNSAIYTVAGDSNSDWSAPNRRYAKLPIPQPPFHDVGVTVVTLPNGTTPVDSGVSFIPACNTYNFGNVAEGPYDVDLKLAGLPTVTATVTGPQAPRATTPVPFPAVTLTTRGGPFPVSCSTKLATDQLWTNNKASASFFVNVHDVAPTAILSPAGVLPAPQMVIPQASARNHGTLREPCTVTFMINTSPAFSQTISLPGGLPYVDTVLTYGAWFLPAGPWVTTCSTYLATDQVAANNVINGSIVVGTVDITVTGLVAPTGSYDTTMTITPTVTVKNNSSVAMSFPVKLWFDSTGATTHSYDQIIPVTGLSVGTETTLVYPVWAKPHDVQTYAVTCSAYVSGDLHPADNVRHGSFTVALGKVDIAVTAVLAPVLGSTFDTGVAVTPSVKVKNNGSFPYSLPVELWFDSTGAVTHSYDQVIPVTGLGVGTETTLVFPVWAKPHDIQTYALTCSTYAPGDTHPADDVVKGTFRVIFQLPTAVWTQMTSLPPGGKAKNVKDGGALAYGKEISDAGDTGYVYAFKGNNRYEFYRYNTLSNTWISRDSIPAKGLSGKKKAIKKGAALAVGTDGKVYGTKGNNTLEFWCYNPYLPDGMHWNQLTDVPAGGKNVKEGTGLAAVNVAGTDYIYMLKGAGTYEFYRYNIETGLWDTSLPTAPGGYSGKPFKYGSSIAYDGNDTIWCLKGTYNDFAAYSISGNVWVTKDSLPKRAPGSTKKIKIKAGSSMAYANRIVYALKGANSNDFWNYNCNTHTWAVGTAMTTLVKRVNGGGALVAAKDMNALYAFRGNNTLEYWMYGPILFDASYSLPKAYQGEMVSALQSVTSYKLLVSPNPFARVASVSYSMPKADNVSLKLYDVTGTLVATLAKGYVTAGSHSAVVNAEKLARGIYLLKFESGNYTTTNKLIIE